jgi:uncharacterized membrane protein
MKTMFQIIFIYMVSFSCTQNNSEEKQTALESTYTQDTLVVVKDSSKSTSGLDSLLPGAYQGIFPCNDCKGIQQTILFKKDNTYKQEQVAIGKYESPKMSYGSWHIQNNKIQLSQNDDSEILFRFSNDTLFAQKINHIPIADSSKYTLTKRLLASESSASEIKRKEGIDFAGKGNEPFWQLDIIDGKSIRFKMPDWKTSVIAPLESMIENSDSLVYHLVTHQTKWSVTVFPQFCDDSMNDFLYEYIVQVHYNDETYKGCGVKLEKMEKSK